MCTLNPKHRLIIFSLKHLSKDDKITDFYEKWSINQTCDTTKLQSSHPLTTNPLFYLYPVLFLKTHECRENEFAYFKIDMNFIGPQDFLGQF